MKVLLYAFLLPAEEVDDPCIIDLAFVLDASASITNDWENVKQFVAGVVRRVNVSVDGSHIAITQFGLDSTVVLTFSEGQNKDDVIRRVLALPGPKRGANTQLHLGLIDTEEKVFNEAANLYRTDPSVRKVRPDKLSIYSFGY